jgi:hypothetical protein
MTAWVVTCNASIVPKTAAQYTQLTSTGFDTFRRSVEPVVGRLIPYEFRRRFNEVRWMRQIT